MLDIQSFRLWVLHVLVVSGCWSTLGSELAFSSVTYHDAASLHVFLMEWAVSAKPVQKGQCKTNVFCTAWHDWDTRPYFSRATSANFSNTKVHIHSTSYSVNFRNLIVKNKILSVLCFVFSFWPPLEIEWVNERLQWLYFEPELMWIVKDPLVISIKMYRSTVFWVSWVIRFS